MGTAFECAILVPARTALFDNSAMTLREIAAW